MSNQYFKIEPGHIITDEMISEMVESIIEQMGSIGPETMIVDTQDDNNPGQTKKESIANLYRKNGDVDKAELLEKKPAIKSKYINCRTLPMWRESYSKRLAEENDLTMMEVPGVDAFIGAMIRSMENSMLTTYKPFLMLLGVVQNVLKNPVKRIPKIPKEIKCIVQGIIDFLKELPNGSAIQLAYEEIMRDYVDKSNVPVLAAKHVIEIILGQKTFKEVLIEICKDVKDPNKTAKERIECLDVHFLLPASFALLIEKINSSAGSVNLDKDVLDKLKEYEKEEISKNLRDKSEAESKKIEVEAEIVKARREGDTDKIKALEDEKLSLEAKIEEIGKRKTDMEKLQEGKLVLDNYLQLLLGKSPIDQILEILNDPMFKDYASTATDKAMESLDAGLAKLENSNLFVFISVMQMALIPLKMLMQTIQELVCFLQSIIKSPVKLVKEVVKIIKNPLEWAFCFISKAGAATFAALAAEFFMANPKVTGYIKKMTEELVSFFLRLVPPKPEAFIAKIDSMIDGLKKDAEKEKDSKTKVDLDQAISYFSSFVTLLLLFYFIISAVICVVFDLKNFISWLFKGGKGFKGCDTKSDDSDINCSEEIDCDAVSKELESFMMMYNIPNADAFYVNVKNLLNSGTNVYLTEQDRNNQELYYRKSLDSRLKIIQINSVCIKFGEVEESKEIKAPEASDIANKGDKFNLYFYSFNDKDEMVLAKAATKEIELNRTQSESQFFLEASWKTLSSEIGVSKEDSLISSGVIKTCRACTKKEREAVDKDAKEIDNWFFIEFETPVTIEKPFEKTSNVFVGIDIEEA